MTPLRTATFTSPAKPIPSTVVGWDPARPATWPATTSTLVVLDGRAVLVDALMTVAEGNELAAWVRAQDVTLDSVYVTHGHADHFFGATSLLEHFPGTPLVTRPEIVPTAAAQTTPGYLQVWRAFFPQQIAEHPRVPTATAGDDLSGAGAVVSVLVGRSDVETSSVVHVPELGVVGSGDVVYNGIHAWLDGSTPSSRTAWLASLDAIEGLSPRTIVAGHRDPGAPDDDAGRLLDQTRGYLQAFDAAAATADGPGELVAAMLARYPGFGNEYTLWVAAASQFEA